MTSPHRLYPSVYYHIYNRGNNRENIFIDQQNYEYFLRLYKKYITPFADTFAYCLLRNHFHLLVRIKSVDDLTGSNVHPEVRKTQEDFNPSQKFGNLFNAYSKAFNKMYRRSGSLFQNPFGRMPVTSDAHLIYLIVYIHRNPQKHGLTSDYRNWAYSSYPVICSKDETFLDSETVIAWFYGRDNFIAHHNDLITNKNIESIISDDMG